MVSKIFDFKNVVPKLLMGAVLAFSICGKAYSEGLTTEEAEKQSLKLYKLLNSGLPLLKSNPLYSQVVEAVKAGNITLAIQSITNPKTGAPSFYNNAIASLPQTINRTGTAVGPRTELSALFIGYARDSLKFNEMFWANRVYTNPNINGSTLAYNNINPQPHFTEIFSSQNPRDALVASTRLGEPMVGIFTSSVWGSSFWDAGTSRRNWGVGILEGLYCMRQDTIRTLVIPDTYVGRDVPRAPGGDTNQFLKNCKGCHAQMDALRPAFLDYNFDLNKGVYRVPPTDPDYENINEINFPGGHRPTSSAWYLYVSSEQNAKLGFSDAGGIQFQNFGSDVKVASGTGLDQFGKLIGNAKALYRCMIRRIVSQVYLGKLFSLNTLTGAENTLLDSQNDVIERFAGEFASHQNLRKAYEDVARYYFDAIED